MRKRRPAPSTEDICDAIEAAQKGKGRALAKIIKSFSEDDLVAAFNATGGRHHLALQWDAVLSALAFASGRKEFRDDMNRRLRDAGNKAVREWKRQQKEART